MIKIPPIKSKDIYYYLIIFVAVTLPISMFLLSNAMLLLAIYWLLTINKERLSNLWKRSSVLVLCLIYLVHLAGLIYSSDLSYGLKDIRIKLPLILFPIVIGTCPVLNFNQIKNIIICFGLAVFINSAYSTFIILGLTNIEITDIRQASYLIPHIRFALLIIIAIFADLYYLLFHNHTLKRLEKIYYITHVIWLTLFLIMIRGMTGIVISVFFGYGLVFFLINKFNSRKLKLALKIILILIPLFVMSYLIKSIHTFYHRDKIDTTRLVRSTSRGNKYTHYTDADAYENGHAVWLFFCEDEIRKAWNKRSKINYYGTDKHDQQIKYTLIRYLTSKNLRKDADGIARLTDIDIHNIELGLANYIYAQKLSLYPKIYEIMWEIDNYIKGGNPSGHSVTQRIIYLETALLIIRDHFWFGTGTGDVADSFNKKYDEMNSPLDMKWRLRAHNQFVTFFLTFGVLGFLIILFAIFFPVFYEHRWNSYLFIMLFTISAMSMLNEDTLETHVGVSMVAFFYCLFLFSGNTQKE